MVQRFFAFNDWPAIHGSRRGFCYAFNYLCSSRSRVHKRSRRHLLVKLCLFSVEAENTVSAQCFFLLSQICWLRERSQHTVITAWNQPGLFEQLLNLGMWVWLNKIERGRKINRETGPRCFVETIAPHHYRCSQEQWQYIIFNRGKKQAAFYLWVLSHASTDLSENLEMMQTF